MIVLPITPPWKWPHAVEVMALYEEEQKEYEVGVHRNVLACTHSSVIETTLLREQQRC